MLNAKIVNLLTATLLSLTGAVTYAQAADAPQAVTYWIELVRSGQTMHVTQKTTFMSGDKIKFHIKPNSDSYAYVILKSGSQGEKSVLFPLPNSKDNNHLAKGVDYAIPSDDYLEFDANPGTERVCLTLSRAAVDAKTLLADGMRPDDTRVVMKAQSGSKDLVPVKIKVTYSPAPNSPDSPESGHPGDKPKKYAPAGISYKHDATASTDESSFVPPSEDTRGEVTVTQSEPGNSLNIDVDLSHAS